MNPTFLAGLILVALSLCNTATAEVNASPYMQTRIAEIHTLDYATKTAIMSGYRYAFSGVLGYDLPKIRLYGSDFGAYELLEPGMRVRVTYRLSADARIVIDLQQVHDSTPLGVPEDQ